MPVARFRKKPIVIEAIQWSGGNEAEIRDFSHGMFEALTEPSPDDLEATATVFDNLHSTWVLVYPRDWIIKGIARECYPCRDSVFHETYESVSG